MSVLPVAPSFLTGPRGVRRSRAGDDRTRSPPRAFCTRLIGVQGEAQPPSLGASPHDGDPSPARGEGFQDALRFAAGFFAAGFFAGAFFAAALGFAAAAG